MVKEMKSMPATVVRRHVWMLLAAVCLQPALADGLTDRFDFHAFGDQTYAKTDHNTYVDADPRGTWDNNFLGLVMAATITDRSKLWAQLETSTEDSTRFTWFFVDYQFTSDLTGHIGRVRLPLGLYNDIVDTKFLQQGLLEPNIYQPAADFVHDSYQGIGFDYDLHVGKAGDLLWQVFGGNSYVTETDDPQHDRRLYGVRVTYSTPISGLRFMVSAYQQQFESPGTTALHDENRAILSGDYVNDRFNVKSEFAVHSLLGVHSRAYYAQLGYQLSPRWTPYLRYEDATTDESRDSDPAYFQRTAVTGVSFRLQGNIDIRAENHWNHGYGLPVSSGEVAAGTGKTNWNLTLVGVAFAL
jgi:hypothetical protein